MTSHQGRPSRVLVIARLYPAHDNPGRGTFVADQVSALAAAGLEVAVVCPVPMPASRLDGAGRAERLTDFDRLVGVVASALPFAVPRGWGAPRVPVLRAPVLLPIGGDATRHPADLADLATRSLLPIGLAVAKRWPFDVIHLHNGLPDGPAAAALADRLDRPLVVTEHDSTLRSWTSDDRARAAYRQLIGSGSRIVAVSSALAPIAAAMAGVPANGVTVVPNVVPIEGFQAAPSAGRDPDQLLWVGARKLSKGLDTLLRAVALAREERPALRLRMIGRPGSDDEEERLRALAAELGLDERAVFEPPTDRANVAAAMATAGVFVHPSPWETFGVVAAEAIATGLPVAATPSGGVEDIVGRDGRFGAVADAATPEALARAIAQVLARWDQFDADVMHTTMASRYAPEQIAARLTELYEVVSRERAVGDGPSDTAERPAQPPVSAPEQTAVPAQTPSPALAPAARDLATGDQLAPLPVVLGLRRPATLERLRAIPWGLAGRMVVVTLPPRPGVDADHARDAAAAVTLREADGEGVYAELVREAGGPLHPAATLGRLARAIRHPVRTRRLRELLRRHATIVRAEQHRVILGAAAAIDQTGAARLASTVLALDVDDIAIIRDLLGERIELSPLTLPALVDRHGAAPGAAPDAAADAAPETDGDDGLPMVPDAASRSADRVIGDPVP